MHSIRSSSIVTSRGVPNVVIVEKKRYSRPRFRNTTVRIGTIFSPEAPAALDRSFGNSRGVRRIEGRKLFFSEELPDVIAEEARALWGIP